MPKTPPPEGRRFQKGQSGNPGGRPKGFLSLMKEAQVYGQEALDFIVNILRDEEKHDRLRLDAARELLDRGFGKPKQNMELSGEGLTIQVIVKGKEVGNDPGNV